MAKRRRTDNTMAKRRRTDNTMAIRRRTDNTMAIRRRTDNIGAPEFIRGFFMGLVWFNLLFYVYVL
jgi:hypothetical protein